MGKLVDIVLSDEQETPKRNVLDDYLDDIEQLLRKGFTRKQILKGLNKLGVSMSYESFCQNLKKLRTKHERKIGGINDHRRKTGDIDL